ncbi:MAG: putative photosynthetic complex assembly protein PuhE [Pseudomonadota bacterium]
MDYAFAVTFALFLWWFSTGAVLYVVGLPKRTHGWSMLGLSALSFLALILITVSSSETSVLGAYCAFTCAIVVWAWHEMSFLTGLVTGPSRDVCPADSKGWRRFAAAAGTLIYHEVAIVFTLGLVAVMTWGAPNKFAFWTLLVLWIMRLSTKFNVFLGVPNLTEEFLPSCLSFLKSYFRKRPMNLLFPVSVTLSTMATWVLIVQAADGSSGFAIAGFTMLAALMALAVLEHWFLVLPLPVADLWRWGLSSRRDENKKSPADDDFEGHTAMRPIHTNEVPHKEAPLISFLAGR